MALCPPPPPPPGTPPPPPGWLSGDECFPAHTLIPTDQGIVEVQDLTPTHSIKNNFISDVVRSVNVCDYMIMFDKDSLGPNMPDRDLLISRQHRIFFNKKKTRAEEFLNGVTIRKHHTGHNLMFKINMQRFAYIKCYNLMVETGR
jgi:hypothetical protein